MLTRSLILVLLCGLSGCSGLKLQLEVQRDNQTLRASAQQALGPRDRVALHIQLPQDSYVYLAHSPAQRDTRPIYPVTGPLRLTAGKLHRVPADGSFLSLEDVKNDDSLCIMLSPKEIKGVMPRCEPTGGLGRGESCGKDCEPKETKAKDRGPDLTIVPLRLSQCIPAKGTPGDVDIVVNALRSRIGSTGKQAFVWRDKETPHREHRPDSPPGPGRKSLWVSVIS